MKTKVIFICLFAIFSISTMGNAATWYVSANGTGTACTSGSPCALSYTIGTKCVAGDTVIVNPGAYSGTISLTNASKHQNITITTTDAVKSALGTFTRGIPSGTDNRPIITGTINISVTGTTVEYLNIRGNANPDSGDNFWGVIDIRSPVTTIQYCKIGNGGAAIMVKDPSGRKTFRHNYLYNASVNGTPGDTHMLYFCGSTAACGGTGAQPPSSWTDKTLVEYNTFAGSCGGDLMQFVTASHNTETKEKYVEFGFNDFIATADEQMIDTKGADYVSIHDNSFTGKCSEGVTGTSGYAVINTTYDNGGANQANGYWYIYNNVFRPSGGCPMAVYSGASTSHWFFWNNIVYDSINTCFEYPGTTYNLRQSFDYIVHNTFINNDRSCSGLSYGGVMASSGVIRNNIFYNNGQLGTNNGSISTRDGSGATVTHNFIYPTSCPGGSCETGTNSQSEATPQVIDAAGGNYTLKPGVRSIGTGIALSDSGLFTPSIDIAGNRRNNPPSLGAYEYGSDNSSVTAPKNVRIITP